MQVELSEQDIQLIGMVLTRVDPTGIMDQIQVVRAKLVQAVQATQLNGSQPAELVQELATRKE